MIDISSFSLDQFLGADFSLEDLRVEQYSLPFLRDLLYKMILIRQCEYQIAEGRKSGLVNGPVHLGVGQEGVSSGISVHLTSSDRVFGAHRSHSHLLGLGSDPYRLFSEILCKPTGCSHGRGASMHLWDGSVGFLGSVPIVAGTVSLAVGAAMAARMQGNGDLAVAYLGDGACEEGVVHESLNLASVQKDPIIFVVENNMFASHMHITKRQPVGLTSRFAFANNIPYSVVDGNNVVSVSSAFKELADNARKGYGPGFLEAVTYRWFGHVDWRDDIDVGVNRSQEDVLSWRKKDPILRLSNALINSDLITQSEVDDLTSTISNLIQDSWTKALSDPPSDPSDLLNSVYFSS